MLGAQVTIQIGGVNPDRRRYFRSNFGMSIFTWNHHLPHWMPSERVFETYSHRVCLLASKDAVAKVTVELLPTNGYAVVDALS